MSIKLTEGMLCQVKSLFILNNNSNLKGHLINAVSNSGPFIYLGESVGSISEKETFRFYSLPKKKIYSLWQESLNKYYALEIIL